MGKTPGNFIVIAEKKKRGKLGKWETKGYYVCSAQVRFVVAWKPKDAPKEEKESAIVLADLVMRI